MWLCLRVRRPPYLIRCPSGGSLAVTDAPLFAYKGTLAWRAPPLRLLAKARASGEFIDVQMKIAVVTDAVLSKLQLVADVPPSLYAGRHVLKCSSKPPGASWRAEKSQIAWLMPTMSQSQLAEDGNPSGTLQIRVFLAPLPDTDGAAAAAAAPVVTGDVQFADLKMQCMYSFVDAAPSECKIDVSGVDAVSVSTSVVVKALFLPAPV